MYQKPVAEIIDIPSEGVFTASGAASTNSECDGIRSWINSTGKWSGHWKIQVGWAHNLSGHSCKGDILTVELSTPCTFYDVWGSYKVLSGDGTTTIKLQYTEEAAGNVVSDLHFDSPTQPTMTNISVEHGQL